MLALYKFNKSCTETIEYNISIKTFHMCGVDYIGPFPIYVNQELSSLPPEDIANNIPDPKTALINQGLGNLLLDNLVPIQL